jgi:hypothetical protein
MIQRIRSVGVAQFAKVLGVLYLFMGVCFAVLFWLFSMAMPSGSGAMPMLGVGRGIGIVIVMPLIYAFFGVVFGALFAWFYNMVAGWVGGIELDLEP